MIDVDALIRTFRAEVPLPPVAATDIAVRAVARAPQRTARVRGRFMRHLAVASGGVATAGLAVVVALLFVAGDKSDELRRTSSPRVDWGLVATIRVAPDPGVDQAEATAQAMAALRARGESRSIAGLDVTQSDDDELTLRVPAAKHDDAIEDLVRFTGFAAFDATSVLASGSGLRDLSAVAERQPGPRTQWVVAPYPMEDGLLPRTIGSREEAERYQAGIALSSPDTDLLALPDDTRLLVRPPTGPGVRSVFGPVLLVANRPFVGVGDVERVRADGSRLVLAIRRDARERMRATLQQSADVQSAKPTTPVVLPFAQTHSLLGTTGFIVGYVSLERSAPNGSEIVIDPAAGVPSDLVSRLSAEPLVPGLLTVESTARYGEVPPLTGETVPLPRWLEVARRTVLDVSGNTGSTAVSETAEIPAKAIVRIMTVTTPSGTRELWAGRAPSGTDAIWLTLDGKLDFDTACDPQLGAPIASFCLNGSNLGGSVHVGRVGPDVASVERLMPDGTVVPGTIRHGWYLIATQVKDDLTWTNIRARDASGAIVAETNRSGWKPTP